MEIYKLILALTVFPIINGCVSNKYKVTYISEPPGAQVYCEGVAKGYTPLSLYYTLDDQIKSNGVLVTPPCGVKWMSGAIAPAKSQINLYQFPNGVELSMFRPDTPNAHIDHMFALQLQQSQKMNQLIANQQLMRNEQERVKNEKQQEDRNQQLCNLGLLSGTYYCK